MKKRTHAELAASILNAHAHLLTDVVGRCGFDDLRGEGDRLVSDGYDSHAVEAAIHNVSMAHGIEAK